VLQGVEPVVAEFRDVFSRRPDAEYAALFLRGFVDQLISHDEGCSQGAVGDITESTVTRV
jgi:hypothetical protein